MSNETFDLKILSDKLSKLNNSQQCIESHTNYDYYITLLFLSLPMVLVKRPPWHNNVFSNFQSALSHWCISHRKKARQVVETWEKMFNLSQKEQSVSFLYLANDILQHSRKKGNEFVNEFWKVLPAALKHVCDNCNQSGKKAATRLVEIWDERKVFGSRIQSLKDAVVVREVKDPAPQIASNEKGSNSNPIKIVKKDSQSLRIKLSVGGFPERIVSAFHSVHEECSNEESALAKYDDAVLSAERIMKEVENNISQGVQPGPGTTDEIQVQENVLEHCVRQFERAEATRAALISTLNDALQDQEAKTRTLRNQLQVACRWLNDIQTLKPKLSSRHSHGHGALTEEPVTEHALQGSTTLQIPLSQPPGQPATSFASLAVNDEESKKAAAAAVAAKLAASTSSAQMLTSVLSSLMAEQVAKVGFNANTPMFPPEKRPKVVQQSSGLNSVGPQPPPLPPTPPPHLLPPNSQSAGMMLNMMPYGFSGGNALQPPPPPPLSQASHQGSQPLQPPLPPQNGSGGYYRPPGIGHYGSSSQPSTPPVQRHS